MKPTPWFIEQSDFNIAKFFAWIHNGEMIRSKFLFSEDRAELELCVRDGSSEHCYGRRANAILLLDDGLSCSQVSKVLFLDDDTVRKWYCYWIEAGIDGLLSFGFGGSDSFFKSGGALSSL